MKLFRNANIFTVDSLCPTAEAFVVKDGRFVFVGSLKNANEYINKFGSAEEIDLGGQLVLPGFIDSHMHYLHYAKSLRSINLSGTKSIGEIKERIESAIAKRVKGDCTWMEGEGWNQDYFVDEKRFPNKFDIDDVSGDVPLLIMRSCFHIGVLNSVGLKILNLNRETAGNYGNLVELLPNGEPSGVIKEGLLDAVKPYISTLTPSLIKTMIDDAQKSAFAHGITCVQSDDFGYMPHSDYDLFFNVLHELQDEGKLKIHIGAQCLLQKKETIQEFFDKGYKYGNIGEGYSITCVKLLLDGSLGARTAAMRKPYNDMPNNRGIICFSQEDLNELVLTAHKNGCPVAIHAIGDYAIEMCLDAIEYARKKHPEHNLRDGIVHCQITDKGLLNRFKDLNVLAFVQPIFIDYDMDIVESRVGEELASTSYAWKSMIDLGIHTSFGTDCPVEKFNTMENIYSAVTRRNITSESVVKKVYLPEEAVSIEDAIRAYTIESAYAAGQENERGSITEKKVADFIVLNRNLFDLDSSEEILNTNVVQTYINGNLVYEAFYA